MIVERPEGSLQQRRLSKDRPQLQQPLQQLRIDTSKSWDFEDGDGEVEFTSRYQILRKLGEGSSAVVYQAGRKSDGENVVLKRMRSRDPDRIKIAEDEYKLLKTIYHPNIIRTLDFERGEGAALVLEFFDGSTLYAAVRQSERGLPEHVSQKLFLQLLSAVSYMHDRGIIHRDIKSENILVDAALDDLRLTDFNTATNASSPLSVTGTTQYAAPEVLSMQTSPSAASDVWGSGLCLYLMLAKKMPSQVKAFKEIRHVVAELYERPICLMSPEAETVSEQCKATLHSCLEVDPSLRGDAKTLLAMEWLQTALGG